MPKKTEPLIGNLDDVAQVLSTTERSVRRWLELKDDPMPVISRGGGRGGVQIDIPEAVQWWNRYTNRGTRTDPQTGEALDGNLEMARLRKEQADGQALKNSVTRREMAPVAAVEWTLSQALAPVIAALDAVPVRLKRMIPSMTAADVDRVKTELAKIRNEAAEAEIDWSRIPG